MSMHFSSEGVNINTSSDGNVVEGVNSFVVYVLLM